MIAVQVKKLFHTLLMNWNNLLFSSFPFLRYNCMCWIMVSRAALLILLKLENFITIKFCSLKNFGSLSFRKKKITLMHHQRPMIAPQRHYLHRYFCSNYFEQLVVMKVWLIKENFIHVLLYWLRYSRPTEGLWCL